MQLISYQLERYPKSFERFSVQSQKIRTRSITQVSTMDSSTLMLISAISHWSQHVGLEIIRLQNSITTLGQSMEESVTKWKAKRLGALLCAISQMCPLTSPASTRNMIERHDYLCIASKSTTVSRDELLSESFRQPPIAGEFGRGAKQKGQTDLQAGADGQRGSWVLLTIKSGNALFHRRGVRLGVLGKRKLLVTAGFHNVVHLWARKAISA